MTGLWQVIAEFEEEWADGKVQGWDNEGQENGHVSAQPSGIDLDYYSTVEELMEVGPERLKEVGLTVIACMSCIKLSIPMEKIPSLYWISSVFH